MYDERLQDLEKTAEQYDVTTLFPASNMLIIKRAAEHPELKRIIEKRKELVDGLGVTWTENTAEITVKRQ